MDAAERRTEGPAFAEPESDRVRGENHSANRSIEEQLEADLDRADEQGGGEFQDERARVISDTTHQIESARSTPKVEGSTLIKESSLPV